MASGSTSFQFNDDPIALPRGAWAATERRTLRFQGRAILSLTQGRHRNYVFPLYTPAGYLVTSEAPADHPHHNSCWIAADHVHCKMPAMGGRLEDYTYNFYLNENFQGRAPGSIVETGITGEQTGPAGFMLIQDLEWIGPAEWAAPSGRLAARERRTFSVTVEPRIHIIDIESRLSAADWDFTIGPTRHAYFNVRVAESMAVTSGGIARGDRASSADAITKDGARWVDYMGPVGGGSVAGVTVIPGQAAEGENSWFVSDWGVVTVGPFRNHAREVIKGGSTALRYRLLAHDGSLDDSELVRRYEAYTRAAHESLTT
jgi:hypothetical protein